MSDNILQSVFGNKSAEQIAIASQANATRLSQNAATQTREAAKRYLGELMPKIDALSEMKDLLEGPQVEFNREIHTSAMTARLELFGGMSLFIIFPNGESKPICARLVGPSG